MPYFSNKIDDKRVEEITRAGGEELATALANFYEMIAHLEQERLDHAKGGLEFLNKSLEQSLGHFSNAAQRAEGGRIDLRAATAAEVTWLQEPLAWMERRGIPPGSLTDIELFRITLDALTGFREGLRRLELTDRPPNFESVNTLVRTAIDLQLLTLGVTAMFELSRRSG